MKNERYLNLLLSVHGLLMCLGCCCVCVEARAGVKGNVEVGVDVENKNNTKVDVEAELKFKSKRAAGLQAEVEAKASGVDRDAHLEDVLVDYRFSKKLHINLGYSKKILGLEYEQGKQTRLSIHRSSMYRKMESLGLVGRQINLRLEAKLGKKKKRLFLSAALGGDNSRDYNLQFSIKKRFRDLGVGVWTLLEQHRIDKDFMTVYAEVASAWYETDAGKVTLEVIHGVDAIRTEYLSLLKKDRTVHFLCPKMDMAKFITLGKETALVPFVQAGMVFDDLDNAADNSLLFAAGTRFQWHGLRIGLNVEAIGVKDPTKKNHRDFHRRSFYGQVIYFF
ncbi:MAG: hypothetical protein JXR76_12920 [Deltaproteobacteria bacterium]|nr:hypothetical protein [Deltaproteobacteria bacterium]